MTHKTTRKEEDYFEARVQHWQRVLSLGDWKIEVYRKKLVDRSAECEIWRDAHGAHIRLNAELEHETTKPWLDRLALHEVGHVLLYDFKQLIYSRMVSDNMVDTIEHAIIRRLENSLGGGMGGGTHG